MKEGSKGRGRGDEQGKSKSCCHNGEKGRRVLEGQSIGGEEVLGFKDQTRGD